MRITFIKLDFERLKKKKRIKPIFKIRTQENFPEINEDLSLHIEILPISSRVNVEESPG